MGIKIKDLVKEVKKNIVFPNLLGKKVAIDAFNTLYQFLSTIRQRDGTPLKDVNGNITSHLSGLFYRTLNFIEKDIKVIYVFDGDSPDLKDEETERRKKRKEYARKKMMEARERGDIEEAGKYAKQTSKLTNQMILESKELIDAMGLPYVQAPSEGEAQAVQLIENGDAWGCASQDYDTLLFGANRLIRNFAVGNNRTEIEFISLHQFLEKWEVTREQLVDMGILIGTDFYEGVKGVGQKTALKLVKQYGDLETICKKKSNYNLKDDWDRITAVRELFLHPDVDEDYPTPKWSTPKYDKIKEILIERHGFSPKRINNGVNRLEEKKSSKTQKTIDSFFKKR